MNFAIELRRVIEMFYIKTLPPPQNNKLSLNGKGNEYYIKDTKPHNYIQDIERHSYKPFSSSVFMD